jgi:hypothetical protein
MKTRLFEEGDVEALKAAIARDTFHPGEWKVEHFQEPTASATVIEDDAGPIVFVRYTASLRISCVWNDETDAKRNAKAIIFGIRQAVEAARANAFTEIIITTNHDKLANFFTQVLKMERSGDEYILAL